MGLSNTLKSAGVSGTVTDGTRRDRDRSLSIHAFPNLLVRSASRMSQAPSKPSGSSGSSAPDPNEIVGNEVGIGMHQYLEAAQRNSSRAVKHRRVRGIPAVFSVEVIFEWMACVSVETIDDQANVPNSIAIKLFRTSRIMPRSPDSMMFSGDWLLKIRRGRLSQALALRGLPNTSFARDRMISAEGCSS